MGHPSMSRIFSLIGTMSWTAIYNTPKTLQKEALKAISDKIDRFVNQYGSKIVFYSSNTLRDNLSRMKTSTQTDTRNCIQYSLWMGIVLHCWNKKAFEESDKRTSVAHEERRNQTTGHKGTRLDKPLQDLSKKQFYKRNLRKPHIKQQAAFSHPNVDINNRWKSIPEYP